jgi:hypothetical protein
VVRLRCVASLCGLGADAAALRRRRQHGASAPYGGPQQQQFAPARPTFTPAMTQRPPFAPPTRERETRDAPRTTAELPACFRGLFDFRCVPTVLRVPLGLPSFGKPAHRMRARARRSQPPRPQLGAAAAARHARQLAARSSAARQLARPAASSAAETLTASAPQLFQQHAK